MKPAKIIEGAQARDIGGEDERNWVQVFRGRLNGELASFNYLMGGCRPGRASHFPEVQRDSLKGNKCKWQGGKF